MLEFHPLANLFPLIEGDDFKELVADIKAHGVREWIVMHEGAIIDGRNRWRAALAAKLYAEDFDPYYRGKDGERAALKSGFRKLIPADGDPLAFVVSKNMRRRHLDASQRAMVAAKIANMRQGERTDLEPSASLRKVPQEAAATMLNVSERSLQTAKKVIEKGTPELQQAVERGDITVSAAAEVARQPQDVQRRTVEIGGPDFMAEVKRMRDERTAAKKARRQDLEQRLGAKQRAFPDRKYGVIYDDPAWKFIVRSEETGLDRAAENHYPTMTLEQLYAMPIVDIAADDCVRFMWATIPFLAEALKLLAHQGFDYKSHYIWGKDKIGPGYWGREKHEILLIGTRGNVPCPAMGTQWDSLQHAPRAEHSAKPDLFAEMIEAYFPTLPKIELNRRGPSRPGWDAWGNEAELPPHDPETGEIIEDPEAKATEVESGTAGGTASVRRSTTGQGLRVGVAGTRMPAEEGASLATAPSCSSAEDDIALPAWLDRSRWIDGRPPARAAASIMSIAEAHP